jgi:hypothetical protein
MLEWGNDDEDGSSYDIVVTESKDSAHGEM